MFNFAVAGSLERYQPIQREPAVPPVSHLRPADNVELSKFEFSGSPVDQSIVRPSNDGRKAQHLKGYATVASDQNRQQRRRVWTVSDLMTKNVKCLTPEDSLSKARHLLETYGFRHIPIVNDSKQIVGLLSDRDLLKNSQPENQEQHEEKNFLLVSKIMTKRVLTCFSETPLRLAAHTMLEEGFSSLPVISPDGTLLGILTTGDILKALVNEAPIELWI